MDDGKESMNTRRDRTTPGEGTFVLKGLFGQRAIRLAGFTDGWRIASVTVGKDDVTTVSVAAGTTAGRGSHRGYSVPTAKCLGADAIVGDIEPTVFEGAGA